MIYSISPKLYEEIATKWTEVLADRFYFSGSFEVCFEQVTCRLVCSALVYHTREEYPEGIRNNLSKVVPVWWEFHTEGEEGEMLNDFSFSELLRYLY